MFNFSILHLHRNLNKRLIFVFMEHAKEYSEKQLHIMDVAIELFSANGLYTTTLFHGRCEAHEQTLVVDLDKASGSTLPSGQYWCRVVSPDGITVSPLVLVR